MDQYRVFYPAMRVIEDPNMVETIEDWSHVRSPSRAARRLRQGHRQNIIYRTVPKPNGYVAGDTLIIHPETARQLREILEKRIEREIERLVFTGDPLGSPWARFSPSL